MMLKFAAGAVVALVLAGCAETQPVERLPSPPQSQLTGVEISKHQGGRFIAFVGPRQQHTAPFLDVADTNYFTLRSWLDNKTGETAHQLYVEDSYFGAPFKWDGARDQDNRPLRFVAISRNEITCDSGCSYADEFAATLPEEYLRAHRGGMTVTFTGSDGQKLAVAVPANVVAAQLDALDAVRAVAAKAAAASAAPTAAAAPATAAARP
jgi:hypothetical protein